MMSNISEQDFLRTYDEYADAIFRYCLARIRNKEDALDITQDVFMRTWRYIARGERIDYMKSFLYRVARNALINASDKHPVVSLDELVENGVDPVSESDTEMHLAFQEVMDALGKLDEKYRDAVSLKYVSGLSVKEIASILKTSENVISVRIHRGLEQLRTCMGKPI